MRSRKAELMRELQAMEEVSVTQSKVAERLMNQAQRQVQRVRAFKTLVLGMIDGPAPDSEPDQPVVWNGAVLRFRENKIVRLLLDTGKFDMNALAQLDFPQHDWDQFVQLIGYSLGGYDDLSYISDAAKDRAENYRSAAVAQHDTPPTDRGEEPA